MLGRDHVWTAMTTNFSTESVAIDSPRFKAGDVVRVRNVNPSGHTRSPRYIRNRVGEVIAIRGAFPLPDELAHGISSMPRHVYRVKFTARELWGEDASEVDTVYIELWEQYLQSATQQGE